MVRRDRGHIENFHRSKRHSNFRARTARPVQVVEIVGAPEEIRPPDPRFVDCRIKILYKIPREKNIFCTTFLTKWLPSA